jgi:hypothetical protein
MVRNMERGFQGDRRDSTVMYIEKDFRGDSG